MGMSANHEGGSIGHMGERCGVMRKNQSTCTEIRLRQQSVVRICAPRICQPEQRQRGSADIHTLDLVTQNGNAMTAQRILDPLGTQLVVMITKNRKDTQARSQLT